MLAKLFWINGRNNRLEYWVIGLIAGAIAIVVMLGDAVGAVGDPNSQQLNDILAALPSRMLIVAPLGWIQFMNAIRRCHDRNKSGYWSMLTFVPIAGAIWQFIDLGLLPGTDGDNRYGPPPGGPVAGLRTFRQEDDSSSLGKVDDAYLEAYARRYAAEQRLQTVLTSASIAESNSGGGSFGKRR